MAGFFDMPSRWGPWHDPEWKDFWGREGQAMGLGGALAEWKRRQQGGGTATASAPTPGVYGGDTQGIIDRIMGGAETDFKTPMGEWLSEAGRLRDEGEARRTQTLGYLQNEQGLASKPTLSDEDVRGLMSRESDRITGGSQANARDLRSFFGAAGVFGGGMPTAYLAANELQRMGQIVGARRDVRLQKAQTDAIDRTQRFLRSLNIAGVMNEDPNAALSDALAGATEFRTAVNLGEKNLQAAKTQAKATKSAGQSSLFGSIVGGILGAI